MICRVEDQPAAGERFRHGLYERSDLLRQEIVEYARGKEYRAARRVDAAEPSGVVQVAGDVFLPLSGRQERVAHGDHAGKIEVIDLAGAVVAAAPGGIQATAKVNYRSGGVGFKITSYASSALSSVTTGTWLTDMRGENLFFILSQFF